MSLLATGIGAGVSLLSGIFGGVSAKKEAKKAEAIFNERQKTLDEWYKKMSSEDYLDSDSVKGTLAMLMESNKEKNESLQNNLISSGATAAERVATAAALNENYADALSQLAIDAEERKESIENQYLTAKDQLLNDKYNIQTGKANATNQIIGIGNSLGSSIIELGAHL